jgi:ketosteroid isomerase-like protein
MRLQSDHARVATSRPVGRLPDCGSLRRRHASSVASTPRRNHLRRIFRRSSRGPLTFEPAKIVVSSAGDVAYQTGTYTLSMDCPKGHRVEDMGKFIVAWKRVGNEWKAALDIFNSDKSSM